MLDSLFEKGIVYAPDHRVSGLLQSVPDIGEARSRVLLEAAGAYRDGDFETRGDTVRALNAIGSFLYEDKGRRMLSNFTYRGDPQLTRAANALLEYGDANWLRTAYTSVRTQLLNQAGNIFSYLGRSVSGKYLSIGRYRWDESRTLDSNSVVVSWENPDPKQCEGCPLLRGALLSERNAKIMCSQQRFLNHSEVKGREVKLRFTLGSTGGGKYS